MKERISIVRILGTLEWVCKLHKGLFTIPCEKEKSFCFSLVYNAFNVYT